MRLYKSTFAIGAFLLHASTVSAWRRCHGSICVDVDMESFEYHVISLSSSDSESESTWLSNGYVGLQCGNRWHDSRTMDLVADSLTREVSGHHERLGKWSGVEREWRVVKSLETGCSAARITSTIVYYFDTRGGFEFLQTISTGDNSSEYTSPTMIPSMIPGTAVCDIYPTVREGIDHMKLNRKPIKDQATNSIGNCNNVSTAFPAFGKINSDNHKEDKFGYMVFTGSTHDPGFQRWEAGSAPQSFDYWSGTIQGAALMLWSSRRNGEKSAFVLGPSSNFKDLMIAKRVTDSKSGIIGLQSGIQGHVTQITSGYSSSFALTTCSRDDDLSSNQCGITAAWFGYGGFLKRKFDTYQTKFRISDGSDVLSSNLHYMTDGGSLLTACDYWPQCLSSKEGCIRQRDRMRELIAYHRSLRLPISLYHLDPYWYSPTANGGCEFVDVHQKWVPSEFHFPNETGGLRGCDPDYPTFQVRFMPYLSGFDRNSTSVYQAEFQHHPWLKNLTFEGDSVSAEHAFEFFKEIIGKQVKAVGPSNFAAVTRDGLLGTWFSSPVRVQNLGYQDRFDEGLSQALSHSHHGIPVRTDEQLPSDILASVRYAERVASRGTQDNNPVYRYQANNYIMFGESSLFFRSMGQRPMVDNVWSNPDQSDIRWDQDAGGRNKVCRSNIQHDLISAVLSTGPIGLGDLPGKSNRTFLMRALREDGVILKPASAVLRLDRHYYDGLRGGIELWAAPSSPANSKDVLNSMADLEQLSNETIRNGRGLHKTDWHWLILSTNMKARHGDLINSSRELELRELWPRPHSDAEYMVAQLDFDTEEGHGLKPKCDFSGNQTSRPADSCLFSWKGSKSPADFPSVKSSSGLPIITGSNVEKEPVSCVGHRFSLLAAAPVLGNGWSFLGDLSKIVPVSPQRFLNFQLVNTENAVVTSGLSFQVFCSSGAQERITVAAMAPASNDSEHNDVRVRTIVWTDVVLPPSCPTPIKVLCGFSRRTGLPGCGEWDNWYHDKSNISSSKEHTDLARQRFREGDLDLLLASRERVATPTASKLSVEEANMNLIYL